MTASKPELFRNLALELFAFMDKCTAALNENENKQYSDVAKALKGMRELHKSPLDSLHTVQAFIKTMDNRINGFAKSIKEFEHLISRKALNYGLNLIPDDVLFEIFSFSAESLKEKVGLSLVCRRFRMVMMSTRKMWDGHCLEIGQTPEQMVAIAEGNRFISLKAVIRGRDEVRSSASYKAWARNGGLDPMEFVDRFYKRSLDFIFSLRLEELQIFELESEGEARRVLDGAAMQSVRTLLIRNRYNRLSFCLPSKGGILRRYKTSMSASDQDPLLGEIWLGANWSIFGMTSWIR